MLRCSSVFLRICQTAAILCFVVCAITGCGGKTSSAQDAMMCFPGRTKDTVECRTSGKNSQKYTGKSVREVLQKLNYYGKPVLFNSGGKHTKLLVLETANDKNFKSFDVDLSNKAWTKQFEQYTWWNSSFSSSEFSETYASYEHEYSDVLSEEHSDYDYEGDDADDSADDTGSDDSADDDGEDDTANDDDSDNNSDSSGDDGE